MPSDSKSHLGRVLSMLAATIIVLCAYGAPTAAQDQPAPKWELFGGYSILYPNTTVHGVLPLGLLPLSSEAELNPRGFGGSITYNFNHWLGLTLDGSDHTHSGEVGVPMRIDDAAFWNISAGPKFTLRSHHFSPFIEALVGNNDFSPDAFYSINKLGFMAGGGLDINLTRHVALRLLRADYVYSNYRYGRPAVTPATDLRGVRVQTGIVFMFGGGTPSPIASRSPLASCSADKSMVYARSGDFVAVSANASDPGNNPLTYSWTTSGGAVEGTGPAARWNSFGAAEGAYTVSVRVENGRGGTASCSANILVQSQPNRPPLMSCTTDRTSVNIGETVQIAATASDADNDTLTYSWESSGGRVRGTGASVNFDTVGVGAGQYSVTGHVNDGRGGTADCQLMITAQQPPPPPRVAELEKNLDLHSIYFPTARPTQVNPDGGLVESQEQILLTLAEDFKEYLALRPEAHLILGGHADERGTGEYNKGLTERRVERTKNFLIEHGVPSAPIETRSFGKEDELNADQISEQIAQNPDVSASDRQQMMNNLPVMVLANNRRVDVTLSTTGQESTHRYPFNAKDYLALINTHGGSKNEPPSKSQ